MQRGEAYELLAEYPLPQHISTMVIAEVANVHDGSLGNCHRFIDAVADAGADAVKFQCHLAAESTSDERFPQRFQFHPQDHSRRDYWHRMEFDRAHWLRLKQHAIERDLAFIVSPFSVEAVRRLQGLVDWWKIPSGEVDNVALLEAVRNTGERVILSSGMSGIRELEAAVCRLNPKSREDLIVCQCTTEYPTPAERVGMNFAAQQMRNICYLGGLSDHSGTIYPGIVAAYLGAACVEVHVCWDRRQFGADVQSSLTIDELAELCRGVRFAETMRRNPVDKDAVLDLLPDISAYRDGKRRECVNKYELQERD